MVPFAWFFMVNVLFFVPIGALCGSDYGRGRGQKETCIRTLLGALFGLALAFGICFLVLLLEPLYDRMWQ